MRTLAGREEGNIMEFKDGWVDYEAFGARGDGVADDMTAICEAHAYANEHGLGVRTKPGATYHLGTRALTAVIATETDWNTSRFTIDDSGEVEDNKATLFEVRSLLEPEELKIDRLTRDQRQVDARPERDCFVLVENENKRLYIRRGLNQNIGAPQHDCFVLRRDGSVEADIDWEYDEITRIEAWPIEENTLYLRGGIFTTYANREHHPDGYKLLEPEHRHLAVEHGGRRPDPLCRRRDLRGVPLLGSCQRSAVRPHHPAQLLGHGSQDLLNHRRRG